MLLAILLDRFRQEVNYKNMPFGPTLTQMTIRFHSVGNDLVEIYYLKGRIMVGASNYCVLRIFGLYTSSLLNAACKKGEINLERIAIRGKCGASNEDEACLTIKFNNFPKVQVKDLVLLQRYVQTNLSLSSAELEIQSMVDVPIHQEDLSGTTNPIITPVISMDY
ncbi:hypothetical protein Tco_0580523 [Tanacetum coccineum]